VIFAVLWIGIVSMPIRIGFKINAVPHVDATPRFTLVRKSDFFLLLVTAYEQDLAVSREHVPGVKKELVPPAVQLAGHDLVQVLLHHPDRKHCVTNKASVMMVR
jgi:hypothetical protein